MEPAEHAKPVADLLRFLSRYSLVLSLALHDLDDMGRFAVVGGKLCGHSLATLSLRTRWSKKLLAIDGLDQKERELIAATTNQTMSMSRLGGVLWVVNLLYQRNLIACCVLLATISPIEASDHDWDSDSIGGDSRFSSDDLVYPCTVLPAPNEERSEVQLTTIFDEQGGDFSSEADCTDGIDCGAAVNSSCNCTARKRQLKSKPNPCATSHKGVFYDNDFSYLNDPCYEGNCFGDCLKLNPVGPCGRWGTVDIGGQIRVRYHHEQGMGQDLSGPGTLRFENTSHDFVLARLRLYNNWKVNDMLRIYVEGILAEVSDDEDTYAPRIIDRNFGDFLNLFADLQLLDSLTLRVGRQELLYGAQRLVSPLDWGNTRRTFDGAKLIWEEGDWRTEAFYTYFVPVIFNELDEPDYDQAFYGSYSTYSGWENAAMDLYYLGYDNENPGPITGDFSLHTLGLRMYGSVDSWLWEFEGAPQFGRQSGLGLDQQAGFATAGIGRTITGMPWAPTLWCYYDYASGNSPGGQFNRFNQLFPLAHKYLGFIDAVQRSNIEAPNLLLTMSPNKKVQLLCWYYHFMANQATDIVPSNGGTPTQNTTSKDFGDELDLTCNYNFGPRSSCLLGYSHFWRGSKITAPDDADFFYVQWTTDF